MTPHLGPCPATRWAGLATAAILLMSAVIVVGRLSDGLPIDTDIVSALPIADHDPVVADAIRHAAAAAGRQVTVVVHAEDTSTAAEAARVLTERLRATGVFLPRSDEAGDFARWLFANRAELLCPGDDRRQPGDLGAAIAREASATVATPGVPVTGAMISSDPFLLGLRLMRCLAPPAPETQDAAIVAGSLSDSPYRTAVQDTIVAAVADWEREWGDRCVALDRSGIVFYAHAAAARAHREVSIIGGVGTVAVVVLLWTTLGTVRAPGLALVTVASGMLAGFAACLAVFETISVMTVLFGAALVGIAVDYAIHYMMTAPAAEDGGRSSRLRHILRPLTTGMVTSACGFGALVLFTSPVMTQIAVLATTGLLTSWLFTVGILPWLDAEPRPPTRAAVMLSRLACALIAPQANAATARIAAVLIAAAALAGFVRLTVVDDVRAFQTPPADLRLEEERVRKATGFAPRIQFLLSRGADLETAKRAEEAAVALLEEAAEQGGLVATTRLDPSEARRQRARDLLQAAMSEPVMETFARRLGLNPLAVIERYRDGEPDADLDSLQTLRGDTAGAPYLIAPLTALQAEHIVARSRGLPDGVAVVDPVARYAAVLRGYRHLSLIAFSVAAAICAIAVLLIHRRWSALRIVVPPVLASVAACGITAFAGVPFTFFSGMALLVVLGAGVDFAIFQYDAPPRRTPWVLTAILLAAVTSALSMGLLALSATVPVATFGATVASGVVLSMLFSRLARPPP